MKRLLLLGLACLGLNGCVVAEPQYGYAPPRRVVYEQAPRYQVIEPVAVVPVYQERGYHNGFYHRRGWR